MKIITFSASKGGVGKTTLTYNWGTWLARQGHKVLLIDADYQANLSSTFNLLTKKRTLFNAIMMGNAEIRKIDDNLSILPASPDLDQIETLLQPEMYREYKMLQWMRNNRHELETFDFIIIDTHPDFGTLTKNMIAVSDYVVVPLEPSEYGFQQSKNQFEQRMQVFREDATDPRTGISDITAKVLFVGNKVEPQTNSSKSFEEVMRELPNAVALINKREPFKLSTLFKTPIVDMAASDLRSYKGFVDQYEPEFQAMLDAVMLDEA